jgi:WS/DGAT/MGAT family acyltransferase
LAIARGRLETYRRIAQVHGVKVNDVLLSAVAGGLRDLLSSRQEPVDGLVLRAMVPVSLHQESVAQGNVTSGMAVPLPLEEADPARRLELIAAETAIRKTKARPTLGLIFRSELAQKALLRVFRQQRFENLYVTNVPGPPVPLFFLGAQVLEIFPIVPTAGNVTLGIGAISYAGQFNVTAVADRDLCPDLEVFLQGFQRSLGELAGSTLVESS